jgi:hypothetical protein
MADWFADVTRTMADDKMSRRSAMRRLAGSVAGVTLASALPGLALARKKSCPVGGNCTIGFTNCQGNPNTNCYCFTDSSGKGVCGCNTYCSYLSPCNSNKGCGKYNICIISNGCTGCASSWGQCIFKCAGPHKNCTLGNGHGVTAAR